MNKFSVKLPTSIYIVTWNVCEMDVPNLDVLEELFDFSDKPEIVVVSLQEIDMSLSGIASGDKLNKGKGWGIGLHDALNRKGSYILINMQQLGGVGLFLFIHENSMNNIGEVVFGSVACGVMKLANKGGIALSLKIGSTPILIIGSHLAAEKSNVEKRNNDFHTIINNLDLPHKYDDYSYVFWSGDLNYRLDLDDLDVLNICKTQCWSSLIKYDQLNNEIKKGTAFMKFLEAPIEFAPTYKVVPGSNNFVTSRGPAWCDRILFKTYQQIGITKYSSLNNIKKSDHIPVAGEFTIYPSKVNNQALKQFEESLKKECLELEQYIKPNYNVSIEPKSFFISPFSSKKGLIHITNNGFTPLELIIFIEYEQTNHNDYVVLSERNVVVNINEIVDIDIEVLFNINCIPGPLETNSFIIVIKSNDNECKMIDVDVHIEHSIFGLYFDLKWDNYNHFEFPDELVFIQQHILKGTFQRFFNLPNQKNYPIYYELSQYIKNKTNHSSNECNHIDYYIDMFLLFIQTIPNKLFPTTFCSLIKTCMVNNEDIVLFIQQHKYDLPCFNFQILKFICKLVKEIKHQSEVFTSKLLTFQIAQYCFEENKLFDEYVIAAFLYNCVKFESSIFDSN